MGTIDVLAESQFYLFLTLKVDKVLWHTPLIPALERRGREDL